MKTFSLVCFFVINYAHSNPVSSSSSTQYRNVDISGMMKKPAPIEGESESGLKINLNCKDEKAGKEFKPGEAGFDHCMKTAAEKSTSKKK